MSNNNRNVGPETCVVGNQLLINPYSNTDTDAYGTDNVGTLTDNTDHLRAPNTKRGYDQAIRVYNQFALENNIPKFDFLTQGFLQQATTFFLIAQNFVRYLLDLKKPNRQNYQPLSVCQYFSGWYTRLSKRKGLKMLLKTPKMSGIMIYITA